MSGRTKTGRGRGKSFGNLEAIGLKPGDGVPPPILQPPPLYPPKLRRPLELSDTEYDRNLLSIKQGLRQFMRHSPFFVKPDTSRGLVSIERYRDKYSQPDGTNVEQLYRYVSDWIKIPKELHFQCAKKKRKIIVKKKQHKTGLQNLAKGSQNITGEDGVDMTQRLEQLEKEEQTGSEGEVTGGETEEEYDEEVEEEEGDYQQTYFDPGDEYAVDEDDALEDGPSY